MILLVLTFVFTATATNPNCSQQRGGICQCHGPSCTDLSTGLGDPSCCNDDPTCSECGCNKANQYCGGDSRNPTCCEPPQQCLSPGSQQCVKKELSPFDNLLSIQSSSSGCSIGCSWWDPLGVCAAAEAAVCKLLDALPGIIDEVKEAVMQVVDDLFNKISVVMEKFEAAVLRIEKQAADDAKKLIAQVEAAIKSVTDVIVAKVEELISKSVAEITAACEAIIADVSSLVDSIFSQVTTVLHDFEQFVWKALCTGEGMIKQIELFISASSMTKNLDACECVHDAAVWAVDSCADTCTCAKGIFRPYKCSCDATSWATIEDQNLYYAIRCKAEKEVSVFFWIRSFITDYSLVCIFYLM